MSKKHPIYFGNNPNSRNYDPNLPIGNNKHDESEFWGDDEDELDDPEDIVDEDEKEGSYGQDFFD